VEWLDRLSGEWTDELMEMKMLQNRDKEKHLKGAE
jgi:hypothetical protein